MLSAAFVALSPTTGDTAAKEHADRLAKLESLPDSCAASAEALARQRAIYEAYGVFSPAMIDGIIARLRSFDDKHLRTQIDNGEVDMLTLVRRYFHCG